MPILLGWAWRGLSTPLPDNLALALVGYAGPANHDAMCVLLPLGVLCRLAHTQPRPGDL